MPITFYEWMSAAMMAMNAMVVILIPWQFRCILLLHADALAESLSMKN